MSDQSQANITIKWLEGRETFQADIVVYATGLELDEVVDALHTGLAATEGRRYELVSADISEIVVRAAQASALVKRPAVRAVKSRPNNPVPVSPAKTDDAEIVPGARRQTREGDREGRK